MISNSKVGSAGLQVQWFTQIETGVRGKVVDMELVVNENRTTTYFELEFSLGREVISQDDLDAFGKPRGIEGAQEQAELRKEIIEKELSARGLENTEVTLQKYALPESSLYLYTSDGLITAINADTGFTKWTTEVGNRHYPSIGIGANNNYVAAVNGTTVYCLEAETGKVLFSHKTKGSVSASPAVSDDFIYVPELDGRLEVFPIATNGVGSSRYIGDGRVMARPTVTADSVAWTTVKGYLNVALNKRKAGVPTALKLPDASEEKTLSESDREGLKLMQEVSQQVRARDLLGSISYRLKTGDQLVSQAAASPGMLYATSLGGFVYAVEELRGSVEWQFSTGEEIYAPPIYLGGSLLVVTAQNSLFKLDAKTGQSVWEKPVSRISKVVGASKDKLFVTGQFGNLIILRQDNGQLLGEVEVDDIDLVYQNSISDRLFVGNTNGTIQCLSEANSNIPHFHAADFEKAIEEKPLDETAEPAADADINDPFRTMDSGKADKPDDAIKSDDNPFGGGAGNSDDNPFGGGADKGGDEKPSSGDASKPAGDDNPFGGGGGGKTSDDNPFGGGGN
jgi:outer membrane protein assembly factor BamB